MPLSTRFWLLSLSRWVLPAASAPPSSSQISARPKPLWPPKVSSAPQGGTTQ